MSDGVDPRLREGRLRESENEVMDAIYVMDGVNEVDKTGFRLKAGLTEPQPGAAVLYFYNTYTKKLYPGYVLAYDDKRKTDAYKTMLLG